MDPSWPKGPFLSVSRTGWRAQTLSSLSRRTGTSRGIIEFGVEKSLQTQYMPVAPPFIGGSVPSTASHDRITKEIE
jgi:hypothetical protein